jgi:NAD(P)-dependent dehydrogenase (short-subunit alcohol dehydrogenase family)
MQEFKNKTVFITGAAKGQGRGVALAFAKEGANIIAFDLGQQLCYPAYNRACCDDLCALKADVEALGAQIETYAGDVRRADDVIAAVDAVSGVSARLMCCLTTRASARTAFRGN